MRSVARTERRLSSSAVKSRSLILDSRQLSRTSCFTDEADVATDAASSWRAESDELARARARPNETTPWWAPSPANWSGWPGVGELSRMVGRPDELREASRRRPGWDHWPSSPSSALAKVSLVLVDARDEATTTSSDGNRSSSTRPPGEFDPSLAGEGSSPSGEGSSARAVAEPSAVVPRTTPRPDKSSASRRCRADSSASPSGPAPFGSNLLATGEPVGAVIHPAEATEAESALDAVRCSRVEVGALEGANREGVSVDERDMVLAVGLGEGAAAREARSAAGVGC